MLFRAIVVFILVILNVSLWSQSEICDNGMDDDGDNLVDYLDPECPCNHFMWFYTSPYYFDEVTCRKPFSVEVNPQDSLNYRWYADDVALSKVNSHVITLDPRIDDMQAVYSVEFYNEKGCYRQPGFTVNLPDEVVNLDTTICPGDTFLVGTEYYGRGEHFITIPSLHSACDSNIHLNVFEYNLKDTFIEAAICSGDSYLLNTNLYDEPGMYRDTVLNRYGCDSIITLDLTLAEFIPLTLYDTICEGEVFRFRGITTSATGIYRDTLKNVDCDTFFTVYLEVLEPYVTELFDTFCPDDFFVFNDQTLNNSGTYYDTLPNKYSCDSIIILNLEEKKPPVRLTRNIEIYEGTDSLFILDLPGSISGNVVWYDSDEAVIGRGLSILIGSEYQPYVYMEIEERCIIRDTIFISEKPIDLSVYLPNVFTPNNDGINDIFVVSGPNLSAVRITVFDRWGGIVHDDAVIPNKNLFELWDGTNGNKILGEGNYVFRLDLTYVNGKQTTETGTVSLLR